MNESCVSWLSSLSSFCCVAWFLRQDYWKFKEEKNYENILLYLNTGFTLLFTLECIVKMIGFGFLVGVLYFYL